MHFSPIFCTNQFLRIRTKSYEIVRFYTKSYTNSYEILRFHTKSYEIIRIHADFCQCLGLYFIYLKNIRYKIKSFFFKNNLEILFNIFFNIKTSLSLFLIFTFYNFINCWVVFCILNLYRFIFHIIIKFSTRKTEFK